jgi:AcrR family transcriptional regulator
VDDGEDARSNYKRLGDFACFTQQGKTSKITQNCPFYILDTIPTVRYTIFMKQKDISSATKIAILDAANRVILEQGIESLTIDAVAQEAGISKGGLFYHFPSKKNLIEGMISRLISEIDALLEEELVKSGGDFLPAYIRASFVSNPESTKLSCALIAAVASDPDLIIPLQKRFFEMQARISECGIPIEVGTIIRLALDGMWISDLYGFAPPPPELREKMLTALLELATKKDEA